MPSHYSSREHHVLPTFSEVSGLAPFAAGVGWAFKRDTSKRIVTFFTGDGGAATNDFNAMMRAVTVHKLPALIVVTNNDWAIMTERQAQWAGDLTAQIRAMDAIAVDVDGVDALATYEATRELVARLRNGEGPAFCTCTLACSTRTPAARTSAATARARRSRRRRAPRTPSSIWARR